MELVADLHVHSKYSRAVSQDMVLPIMAKWAKKKGIDILATADWTHPLWFREIRAQLEEAMPGLFALKGANSTDEGALVAHENFRVRDAKKVSSLSSSAKSASSHSENFVGSPRQILSRHPSPLFILSTEISSIYSQGGRLRRIHNLVLSPSFETCEKINQELFKQGCNLSSDGRPIIGISSKNLLELVLTIDKNAMLIPCHAWTPWFALYGSNSGFDSIEECFQDYSKYIYAVETGLSSDPEMNWRIKELENRSIVSSSDSHSPAKMGREATVFVRKNGPPAGGSNQQISYEDIRLAIMQQSDNWRIGYTIEFYPEEGKYHYTGHRNCKVVQSPEETKTNGVICPVCKRPLTVGVMHRVEQLAQPFDFGQGKQKTTFSEDGVKWIEDPTGKHPSFVKLVPLNEIIAEALSSQVASIKVKALFDELCERFDSEFNVLLKTEIREIEKAAGPRIAGGIAKVRSGDIVVEPGFDGEYGKVRIWGNNQSGGIKEVQKKEKEAQLGLF